LIKKKIEEKKQEPNFEILENPARVTRSQIKYISFDVDPRYVPITQADVLGIVMLKDTKPGTEEELISSGLPVQGQETEETEPPVPEPFELE